MVITDAEKFEPVLLGLTLVSVLHKLYPEEFEMNRIIELLGNAEAMSELQKGQLPARMLGTDTPEMQEFMDRRKKALIYR